MRKALIGIAVATALFAVGAFAASFTVQSEDIASGSDSVSACATSVDVDFTTEYNDSTPGTTFDGDWSVNEVVLTFFDGAGAVTDDCDGFGANVAVMTGTSGTPAATGVKTIATTAGKDTVTLSTTLNASEITAAAVLVDGNELQVDTPGQGFPTP